jgi:hypothetical protein
LNERRPFDRRFFCGLLEEIYGKKKEAEGPDFAVYLIPFAV